MSRRLLRLICCLTSSQSPGTQRCRRRQPHSLSEALLPVGAPDGVEAPDRPPHSQHCMTWVGHDLLPWALCPDPVWTGAGKTAARIPPKDPQQEAVSSQRERGLQLH